MPTDKYEFEDIDYGVVGWDGLLQTFIDKVELHLHSRRLGTLAVSVSAYEMGYINGDGKWAKAQAIGDHKQPSLGMFLEAGIADDQVRIQRRGPVTNIAWNWTMGTPVYLSNSVAGGLTQTLPHKNIQVIGYPTSATTLFLEGNINIDALVTTTTTTSSTTTSTTTAPA